MIDFKIGQQVYVNDSAEPDATIPAWKYIKSVRVGTVVDTCTAVENDPTGRERLIALEFADEFAGGHRCNGTTKPYHGQYIAAKHLHLLEYNHTVPNIPYPPVIIEKSINVTKGGNA